jgi:hypothetical protein
VQSLLIPPADALAYFARAIDGLVIPAIADAEAALRQRGHSIDVSRGTGAMGYAVRPRWIAARLRPSVIYALEPDSRVVCSVDAERTVGPLGAMFDKEIIRALLVRQILRAIGGDPIEDTLVMPVH